MEGLEVRAIALMKVKHKKWLKGKKGNIWVGYPNPPLSLIGIMEANCQECKRKIYVHPESADEFLGKKVKKICMFCAVKNHKKEMNEEMVKILEFAIAKLKYSDNLQ
jgi:hypothetical protein